MREITASRHGPGRRITTTAGVLLATAFAGPAMAHVDKVAICHPAGGSGRTVVLHLPPAAVPAHLAHGDVLAGAYYADADGDGVGSGAPVPCPAPGHLPTGGDCDDSDSSVRPGAADDSCDGIDQDCSGVADDRYQAHPTACGTGACAAQGETRCVGGHVVDTCTPGEVGDEACNGRDDDCDGTSDEGFDLATDPRHCGACDAACAFDQGLAACEAGVCALAGCLDGHFDLDGDPQNGCEYVCEFNGLEACNGRDDDCDGASDEDEPDAGQGCDTGQSGACAAGVTRCDAGVLVCDGLAEPTPETCNGVDDDCNGQVDDRAPEPTTCGVGGCAAQGERRCEGGALVDTCTPGQPAAEVCDGLDSDCDGMLLGDGEACRDGNATAGDGCSPTCVAEGCPEILTHEPQGPDACAPVLTTLVGARLTDDTFLVSQGSDPAWRTTNLGTYREIQVGAFEWNNYWRTRTLLRFDLSSVPPDARIQQAELILHTVNECSSSVGDPENCGTFNGSYTVDFTHLSRDFGELEATWMRAAVGVAWAVAGAGQVPLDHTGVVVASLGGLNGATAPGAHGVDVTPSVADWVAGEINLGWRLAVREVIPFYQSRFIAFASADHAECDWRPRLEVVWSPCAVVCGDGLCEEDEACAADCDEPPIDCPAGRHDLDGDPANGCEYFCAVADGPDLPDPAGADTNCDGVDGEVRRAVFVAPHGDDARDGLHPGAAVATWHRAVAIAQGDPTRDQVLIAAGTYPHAETLDLAGGLGLFGGYAPDFRSRSPRPSRLEVGASIGARARDLDAALTLEGLVVAVDDRITPGEAAVALQVVRSASHLSLKNVELYAGRGAAGAAGQVGAPGLAGQAGLSAAGSVGGVGAIGGGRGGNGAYRALGAPGQNGTPVGPACGGLGGAAGSTGLGCGDGDAGPGGPGGAGCVGQAGQPGIPGGLGTWIDGLWTPGVGSAGTPGGPGGGGGGGGAGVGENCQSPLFINYFGTGQGGGGGGKGGQGGTPGLGGGGGGASVGLLIQDAQVQAEGLRVTTTGGGTGGAGALGGLGGAGGAGGLGGPRLGPSDGPGGNGGRGGDGGRGGCGGGGAGGPSVAVWGLGAAALIEAGAVLLLPGPGGLGGPSCVGFGAPGLTQARHGL